MRNTKVKLDAFTELRKRLNGKCGFDCPQQMVRTIGIFYEKRRKRVNKEFCGVCEVEFGFINHICHVMPCPCFMEANIEEILLRVDEYIEELENELSKQYSS